jgi:hypothetical protein
MDHWGDPIILDSVRLSNLLLGWCCPCPSLSYSFYRYYGRRKDPLSIDRLEERATMPTELASSTCVRLRWRDAVQLYASQYGNKVEDITPMNSRQQVYIFCCPVYRPIISVRLNVGFPCGICQDVQECYLSSTPIAMDWDPARVQPMLFPAYELCYHQLLSVTLPCAISQLSHGCRCNLVREWRWRATLHSYYRLRKISYYIGLLG